MVDLWFFVKNSRWWPVRRQVLRQCDTTVANDNRSLVKQAVPCGRQPSWSSAARCGLIWRSLKLHAASGPDYCQWPAGSLPGWTGHGAVPLHSGLLPLRSASPGPAVARKKTGAASGTDTRYPRDKITKQLPRRRPRLANWRMRFVIVSMMSLTATSAARER